MAGEESQGVQAPATLFEVRATCLLVARLGALQDLGDALQIAGAVFDIKRQRGDQCIGRVANLAQRDGRVFPPAAAWSGGLRRDDSPW